MSDHTVSTTVALKSTSKPNPIGMAIKRAFDITIAMLGLFLLSPVFAYLAWRIRRDTPGPVFYHGERVGKGGKIFKIHKFRTMYETQDSYQGPLVTAENDPRITPFGHFLRDTKLNELPQLWNVLKGEMSIVGPRPEDPKVAAEWPEQVRAEILSLRPGITSPSSVRYRKEEKLLNGDRVMETYMINIVPSKLRLDQLYVRQRSFWGDLDVLFWTFMVLLPRIGSYEPSDRRLFAGPINELMGRYINWFLADLMVALVAIGITGLLWRSFGPLEVGWGTALLFAIGFALLCSALGSLFGIQRIFWSRASGEEALELIPPVFLATVITLLINHFVLTNKPGNPYRLVVSFWDNKPLLPVPMILVASALAFVGFVIVRYRSRLFTGSATRWLNWRRAGAGPREQVLVIGGGETGQIAARVLSEGRYAANLQVVGFVDDDLFKQGIRIRGLKVLGERSEIPRLVKEMDIGIIIYAIHNISAEERNQLINICRRTGAQVVLFPDIPAAINGMVGKKDSRRLAAQGSPTPIGYQLAKEGISHQVVDRWLAHLQEYAEAGDLASIQEQIRDLRQQVSTDSYPSTKTTSDQADP